MGDKIEARKLMIKSKVPVVPGSDGPVSSDDPKIFDLAKK